MLTHLVLPVMRQQSCSGDESNHAPWSRHGFFASVSTMDRLDHWLSSTFDDTPYGVSHSSSQDSRRSYDTSQ